MLPLLLLPHPGRVQTYIGYVIIIIIIICYDGKWNGTMCMIKIYYVFSYYRRSEETKPSPY